MNHRFLVISHTHWDREWYMPLSLFRMRLCDLIDRLLALLEQDPSYIFHLDAQTVVIEDYLAIHPGREEELRWRIATGSIRVGPWYLQNDFYLTSGEATVRNLLIGHELATGLGRCGHVGYAPDQFGNVSQLPQILAGFGIDSFIFGRGYRFFERGENGAWREKKMPTEFWWQGADGTRCLAIYMRHWYNNAQHIPPKRELGEMILSINARNYEGLNTTRNILLMNGVDHLEAQADLSAILADLRAAGHDVKQTGLDEYIDTVKADIEGLALPVVVGPLNHGADVELLRGCWSSRVYLKQQNVRMQDLLEHRLEPLYTYLERIGMSGIYPKDELRYLWKSLLKNHPHDSICGCSVDAVHAHMEDRFAEIGEMGSELLRRGMQALAYHTNAYRPETENYSITVFNSTARLATQVVTEELILLADEHIEHFALYDDQGQAMAYEILSREEIPYDVFSPVNLPGVLDAVRVRIRFHAQELPPLAARVYTAVPHEPGILLEKQANTVENDVYALQIENGHLVIHDKKQGRSYIDPVAIEDAADKGDAYVFRRSSEAPLVVLPHAFREETGALAQRVTLSFAYDCPAGYDFAADRRSATTVPTTASVTLTLHAGSDLIEVAYAYENHAADHRVRLSLAAGIVNATVVTDTAFDAAVRPENESCAFTESNTHCAATFAALYGENKQFSVFTEGQHEIEAAADRCLVTILRATGYINRNHTTFAPTGGEIWVVPGNQCMRSMSGRLAFSYAPYGTAASLWERGKQFRCGIITHADSFDPHKYAGGRFAVQAAELKILYYLPDAYPECRSTSQPLIAGLPEEIGITCCKAGEKGDFILRLCNFSNKVVEGAFALPMKTSLTTLSEQKTEAMPPILTFNPKQIITLTLENEV